MSDNYSRDGYSPNATYVFQIPKLCRHCWNIEDTSLLSLIEYITDPVPHDISISVICFGFGLVCPIMSFVLIVSSLLIRILVL